MLFKYRFCHYEILHYNVIKYWKLGTVHNHVIMRELLFNSEFSYSVYPKNTTDRHAKKSLNSTNTFPQQSSTM